ncbi:hypothetical protein [Chryseosolibacter indicus]|nr:hypothetical protein [Chryseosolibacter indicus]
MRSEVGIEGYSKNKNHPSPFKKSTILFHDESSNIVYEVGQSKGFEVYLRPQIVYFNGDFFIEGASDNDLVLLSKVFIKWIRTSLLVVELPSVNSPGTSVQFQKIGAEYSWESYTGPRKRNKIIFKRMNKDDKFYKLLTTRLFLDDEDNLYIRAKSIEDVTAFIPELLKIVDIKKPLNSFSKNFSSSPVINVAFDFDPLMCERAIVKIGLNAFFHCYPRERYNLFLKPAIEFVLEGKSHFNRFFDRGMKRIDGIEDAHSISFFQHDDNLLLRVNLFSGQFILAFWLNGISVMQPSEHSAVDINYRKRHLRFLTMNDLLYDRAQREIKRNPNA